MHVSLPIPAYPWLSSAIPASRCLSLSILAYPRLSLPITAYPCLSVLDAAPGIAADPCSSLLDAGARGQIARIIDQLRGEIPQRDFPELLVEGHTDAAGEAFDNEELARERAESVRDALIEGGIDESVMTVRSFGERAPRVQTPDGRAEARNRRVDLTFR